MIALLGQARIPLQIDVGFGDRVVTGPEEIDFPTLLDFPSRISRVTHARVWLLRSLRQWLSLAYQTVG
jgi:hypothetical protein